MKIKIRHEKSRSFLMIAMASLIVAVCFSMAGFVYAGQIDIQSANRLLALDSRIDAGSVKVVKKGSKTDVSGTVQSLGEKLLVKELLDEGGIKNIDVSKLKVVPPQISDVEIRKSIMVAVPAHCLVKIDDFDVIVKNGNVTIRGVTGALHHKNMAEYVASYTKGVRSVRNLMVVDVSGTSFTDRKIEENLRFRFTQNNLGSSLDIFVKNGLVTLKGNLADVDQKKKMLELAETAPGVARVVDKTIYSRKIKNINY